MKHDPVLLDEILEFLRPAREDGTLVDATLGLGGHSEALLERYPGTRLIGIDRDPEALERSRTRLSRFGDRVTLVQGRHETLIDILKQAGLDKVSGVLADLGVSSMQLDDAARGFSFRFDAPLDMRMGPDSRSAAEVVNTADEHELMRILRDYGEEPFARPIARAIVAARAEAPIDTTTRLAQVIQTVKKPRFREIDPSTLTFQALRIAANEELIGLEQFVDDAVSVLEPGARVAIISFHSLEDRIVKRALRRLGGQCTCPPGLPVCGCGKVSYIKVLTGRPVT
jgi:16S rRNA (cytosine1402-N4)-methyltransferase